MFSSPMPKRRPELPPLTVNRGFMAALLHAEPPVFALGLAEIKGQKRGFLALHPAEAIPADSTEIGVSFGYGLLGRSPRECVIQFSFHFYGCGAYHALVNPNNPFVRTVLQTMVKTKDYWFFLLDDNDSVLSFRSELEEENLVGLKTNLPLIRAATTTENHYRTALSLFSMNPDPPGKMLRWIGGDDPRALDPAGDPLQMTCPEPPPPKRPVPGGGTAPFETPRSPADSLRMLNDTMRTGLLQFVHDGIEMGKALPSGESPLQMLIRSITAIRKVCTDASLLAAIGPNPFNRESRSRPFDPQADARHDLRLLDFHLQALRGLQANQAAQTGNRQTAALPQEPTLFSAEQLRIAERIDAHANRVYSEADGYFPFFIAMSDYMDDFKRLMDISAPGQINALGERYEGFFRFAKCLEEIARGIRDGDISPDG